MVRSRGIPHDLDAQTTDQIKRTFLVVRIVRGSLLLAFLLIAAGAVMAKHWPVGVAVALLLTATLQAARVTTSLREYLRIRAARQ
jgi:hypothetical protein